MATANAYTLDRLLDTEPLIIEREKAEGGFYVMAFGNGVTTLSPIRPNIEALALTGAPMAQMVGIDSVRFRNSAYSYMNTHHVRIDKRGRHIIHHRHGCRIPHKTLRTFWEQRRKQLTEEETSISDLIYNIMPKPSGNDAEITERIVSFKAWLRESLDSLIAKYGYERRAADNTAQYFTQNPKKRTEEPERVYRLLMEYWQSSDKRETRTWESLSRPAGLPNAAQARIIIMEYLGLPSLTQTRPFFHKQRTPQEWKEFLIRAHALPFRMTEIKELSGCPLDYSTIQRQLNRLGRRPWVNEREFRGHLEQAQRIYRTLDELHNVNKAAAMLGCSAVNVYKYAHQRSAAEQLLQQLTEISPPLIIAQAPHQAP